MAPKAVFKMMGVVVPKTELERVDLKAYPGAVIYPVRVNTKESVVLDVGGWTIDKLAVFYVLPVINKLRVPDVLGVGEIITKGAVVVPPVEILPGNGLCKLLKLLFEFFDVVA